MSKLVRTVAAALLTCALVPIAPRSAGAQEASSAAYDAAVQSLAAEAQATTQAEEARTFVNEYGYVLRLESDEQEEAAQSAQRAATTQADLPASYTAPFTSIKNQGEAESCWAFAAVASLESAYLVQQGITETFSDAVDFSEAQIVYATHNGQTVDGTVDGAQIEASFNDYLFPFDNVFGFQTSGGWADAASTLAARRGIAYESDVPFEQGSSSEDFSERARRMAESAAANYTVSRVTIDRAIALSMPSSGGSVGSNGRMLTRSSDTDRSKLVKQAIYSTGAVSVSLYMDPSSSSLYYHQGFGSGEDAPDGTPYFYYPNYWTFDADDVGGLGQESLSINHDVAIVGWDDTYSRWNFATFANDAEGNPRAYDEDVAEVVERDGTEYIVPKEDGAWLIKNSWGTVANNGWKIGDDGMFYVSYCEKTLDNASSFVLADTAADEPLYEIVHQYDGIEGTAFGGNANDVLAGANVFHADEAEQLEALGVWVPAAGSELSISVYTNLSDPTNPESGMLAVEQHESIDSRGWYTLELSSDVAIDAGSSYSVVVSGVWGEDMNYAPVEMATANMAEVRIDEGESFLKTDEGGASLWVDAYDVAETMGVQSMGNVCVKALANPVESPEPEPEPEPEPDPDPDPDPDSDPDAGTDSDGEGSGAQEAPAGDSAADASDATLNKLASTGDASPLAPVFLVCGGAACALLVSSKALRGKRAKP